MSEKKPMLAPALQRWNQFVQDVKRLSQQRKLGQTTSSPSLTQKLDGKTGKSTMSECSQASKAIKSSATTVTIKKRSKKTPSAKYIKVNAVQCIKCWAILVSLDNHDFRSCRCASGGIFIDGGTVGLGGHGCIRFGGDPHKIKSLPLYWKKEGR